MDELAARDEMLTMFKQAWDTHAPTVAGSVPYIEWEEVGDVAARPHNQPWARVMVRHQDGRQASLGAVGSRKFERTGTVTVQVFVPRAEGVTRALALGKIAANVFEGAHSPGGIWFRGVSTREIGPDAQWFQVNAQAEFVYDERK